MEQLLLGLQLYIVQTFCVAYFGYLQAMFLLDNRGFYFSTQKIKKNKNSGFYYNKTEVYYYQIVYG